MPPEEILKLLRLRPFGPFRLHTTDGHVYDVTHPEMAIVTERSAVIGVPGGVEGMASRYDIVALVNVAGLETLASAGNP